MSTCWWLSLRCAIREIAAYVPHLDRESTCRGRDVTHCHIHTSASRRRLSIVRRWEATPSRGVQGCASRRSGCQRCIAAACTPHPSASSRAARTAARGPSPLAAGGGVPSQCRSTAPADRAMERRVVLTSRCTMHMHSGAALGAHRMFAASGVSHPQPHRLADNERGLLGRYGAFCS